MKNMIGYFSFLFVVAGCNKEVNTLNDDLQGKWELKKSFSGWGGSYDYAPGNGNTISFNGNSFTQEIKTMDTAYTIHGSFSIHKDKPCASAQAQWLINMNDDLFENSFRIDNHELSIGATECIADGGSSIYRKISD